MVASLASHYPARQVLVAFLVMVMGLLLGLNLVVVKLALRSSDPLTIQALASAAGAVVMLGTSKVAGHPTIPRGRDRTAAFAVGAAMTVMSSLGLSFGVERVDAGVAAVVMSTTPLVTMLLCRVFLREMQPVQAMVGALLGLLGVFLVSLSVGAQGGLEQFQGVLLLLVGAGGWSLGLVFMKTLGHGVPARPLIAWQMSLGTPVLIVLALLVSGMQADWTVWFGAALLYMGLVAKALTFVLQLMTLRLGSPVQASLTAFLMPVFGTIGGVVFLNESVSLGQFAGAVAILSGVALLLRARAAASNVLPGPPV
ncbi:MAG: DMT family transporter [Acidimicrobiia bacterium]